MGHGAGKGVGSTAEPGDLMMAGLLVPSLMLPLDIRQDRDLMHGRSGSIGCLTDGVSVGAESAGLSAMAALSAGGDHDVSFVAVFQ